MTPRRRADLRTGFLWLAPAFAVLTALTAYPVLWVLWLSLQHRIPVLEVARFAGLAHYAFLAEDPRFWNAAWVTVTFTVVSVALELGLGLLVALALRAQRMGQRLGLSLLLLPWALPSVVTARLFEWLYHPSAGLANLLLGGRPLNWLGDPALALAGVILADVWRTMPFVALLCYARLGTIPAELYEAARVDGANAWLRFRHITVPLLMPVFIIVSILTILGTMQIFDLIIATTQGGPGYHTEVPITRIFQSMLGSSRFGYACAQGIIFGLILLIFSLVQMRFQRKST